MLDPFFFCERVVNSLWNSFLPDSLNFSSLPKFKCTTKCLCFSSYQIITMCVFLIFHVVLICRVINVLLATVSAFMPCCPVQLFTCQLFSVYVVNVTNKRRCFYIVRAGPVAPASGRRAWKAPQNGFITLGKAICETIGEGKGRKEDNKKPSCR